MSLQFMPRPARRRALQWAVIGALSLLLGGCLDNLGGLVSFNCKRVNSRVLQVGQDASCRFRYGYGDMAKYVVTVTRQPMFGDASGQGAYLKYVAKPGFVGEDSLNIRVERRGIGHVQWENISLTVKVGTKA
jgi:hypothetical protein